MTEAVEELLFDLTLTDEQRMNRETMQRFAAAEIRDLSRLVDTGEVDVGRVLGEDHVRVGEARVPVALGAGGR